MSWFPSLIKARNVIRKRAKATDIGLLAENKNEW
jgi:hypothetical protein